MILCTACTPSMTFFDSILSGMDIKSYKYNTELTFDLKAPSIEDRETSMVMQQAKSIGTLTVKLQGQVMETGAMSCAISFGIRSNSEKIQGTEGYIDLTDIIYKEGNCYINIRQFLKAANQMNMGTYKDVLTEEMPSYIIMPMEELSTDSVVLDKGSVDRVKQATEILSKKYIAIMQELITSIEGEILTSNKGIYEIELNQSELSALCDALTVLVTDKLETIIDGTITELETTCSSEATALISSLKDYKTELSNGGKEEIVTSIATLKDNLTEINTFSLLGTSEVKGTVGERTWELAVSLNGEVKHKIGDYTGLSFGIKHNVTEVAYTDVIITPTVYITMDELNLPTSDLAGAISGNLSDGTEWIDNSESEEITEDTEENEDRDKYSEEWLCSCGLLNKHTVFCADCGISIEEGRVDIDIGTDISTDTDTDIDTDADINEDTDINEDEVEW